MKEAGKLLIPYAAKEGDGSGSEKTLPHGTDSTNSNQVATVTKRTTAKSNLTEAKNDVMESEKPPKPVFTEEEAKRVYALNLIDNPPLMES